MSLNINGSNDEYERYKMPMIEITTTGSGGNKYTILKNLDDVSKSLNHPTIVLLQFISTLLNCSFKKENNSVKGHYDVPKITEIIYEYINLYILCPYCNKPETIPSIQGKKKKKHIIIKCSACGNTSSLVNKSKYFTKGCKLIINYLEKNEWVIHKGNMVTLKKDDDFDF